MSTARAIMLPHEAAAVRYALEQACGDDQGRKDKLRAAYAYARSRGAYLVSIKVSTPTASAGLAMMGLPSLQGVPVIQYFADIVRRAAARHCEALEEASQEVCYQVGWLLDQRAPSARIEAVAHRHAGPLPSWEVDALIKREQAWWVRLHADIGEVAHAA